jgi:hypothetical protein
MIIYISLIFLFLNIPYCPKEINNSSIFNTKTNKICDKFFYSYKSSLESLNENRINGLISSGYGIFDYLFICKSNILELKNKIFVNLKLISKINVNFFVYSVKHFQQSHLLVIFLFKVEILVKLPSIKKWAEHRGVHFVMLKKEKYDVSLVNGF